MHFDDRLATVLRQRATSNVTARIQYRQLLDLLGTLPVEASSPRIDTACERLTELASRIAPDDRANMLRDPGLRLRNPRLVALLAGSEPAVAGAVIERAQLDDDEWIDLVPALPIHARGMVRQGRNFSPRVEAVFDRLGLPYRALPPGQVSESAAAAPVASQALAPEEIGAIVKRIEDFRKARQTGDQSRLHDELTSSDQAQSDKAIGKRDAKLRPTAFDFVTDSVGQIIWTDPGMAPMALGLQLASVEWSDKNQIRLAIRQQQPINACVLEFSGAPAIAGRWQIDAKPCFNPISGGFTGYAGRMRRLPNDALADVAATAQKDSEADRMRQVLHELRTPVGAIQGFAEVIQQQMFGPAPHEYRALAASIAADAARILAGFEELERLARLESGREVAEPGQCDLGETLEQSIAQLKHFTDARNGGFTLIRNPEVQHSVAMAQLATEKLVWRLLGTCAGLASPNEQLELHLAHNDNMINLSIALPRSLAAGDSAAPDNCASPSTRSALSTGMFGTGFTLRLAKAEANAAGGSLMRQNNRLDLKLPGLTKMSASHS